MVLGWLILKVVMRNIWKAKIKIEQKIYNAENVMILSGAGLSAASWRSK